MVIYYLDTRSLLSHSYSFFQFLEQMLNLNKFTYLSLYLYM